MSLFSRRGRYTEPGDHRVVLQLPGRQHLLVIRELRRTTGCSLPDAARLAKDAPVVVASGISRSSADAVVARLSAAGARAVATPMEELS